jgi:hypothetical protein
MFQSPHKTKVSALWALLGKGLRILIWGFFNLKQIYVNCTTIKKYEVIWIVYMENFLRTLNFLKPTTCNYSLELISFSDIINQTPRVIHLLINFIKALDNCCLYECYFIKFLYTSTHHRDFFSSRFRKTKSKSHQELETQVNTLSCDANPI